MNTLQTVNYTYNIRGWLTDINDVDEVMDGRNKDLFTFRINYQIPKNNATALFNGNISETYWKTRSDNQKRMYKYDYDGLNRLENASFENLNQNIVNTYNEALTYDKNGNITSLFRTGGYENPLGALTIDNLNYQYDPNSKNQLKKVVDLSNSQQGFKDDSNGTLAGDTSDDYLYDSNGNMTKDENKNITSIVYNHLNLPTKIIFGTGSTSSNITYTYDATGIKLKKVVTTTSTVSTTEYLNGFQYNNNILQFFPTSDGYVNHTFDTVESKSYFNYVYNYTDHLGNIRLSYTWDEDIQEINILEENHYYPFGLKHDSYNETKKAYNGTELISLISGGSIKRPILVQVPNSGYQYQYNGKEYQDELGLNMTAMDFRQYDNAIGRFVGMDRLSEMAVDITPYRFSLNNPVFFSDPTGLWEKKADGSWYTDDKKDIERYTNMLRIETENNGGVSGAQMDLFINEEFQGSGGRLSDGSALLDEVSLKSDKQGNTKGFSDVQASKIDAQVYKFISNSYNEKSFGNNGHWAYSYKYFRERNYYEKGGKGMSGVALSGFVLDITSDFMHNNKFWLGKNLKFYDVKWGGNGFTGGRNKFASKWSTTLGVMGKLATVYGMYGTANDYFKQGKLSASGAAYLGASDGVGLVNVYGSAWSLGTGLGKAVVESQWYFNKVYKDYNW
jgi:RHS repeat-associated protein